MKVGKEGVVGGGDGTHTLSRWWMRFIVGDPGVLDVLYIVLVV